MLTTDKIQVKKGNIYFLINKNEIIKCKCLKTYKLWRGEYAKFDNIIPSVYSGYSCKGILYKDRTNAEKRLKSILKYKIKIYKNQIDIYNDRINKINDLLEEINEKKT